VKRDVLVWFWVLARMERRGELALFGCDWSWVRWKGHLDGPIGLFGDGFDGWWARAQVFFSRCEKGDRGRSRDVG
jgi:hypothetical protein